MKDLAEIPKAEAPLKLTIFGASGATGQQAVAYAHARGHEVLAVDHHPPADGGKFDAVRHVKGDVLSDDLRSQVRGADAVISCLGVGNDPETLLDPPPLYTEGTDTICRAMEAEEIERLIVISATFVETRDRGPLWFKVPAMTGLHLVFEQMSDMEEMLRSRDDIDWTAARPGWLMEGELTADYVVQADVIPEGLIRTRHADLAHFMVTLAETGEWSRQTPAIAREEPASASAPDKVVEDMLGD